MHIGVQLIAPAGWGDLAKDDEYYFAGHSPHGALLIDFYEHKGYDRVAYRHIEIARFEDALVGEVKRLVKREKQRKLPHWLEDLEGMSFESANSRRYKKRKRSYTEEVESREKAIAELLEHREDILSANDPLARIAQLGRQHVPNQHPYRLQTWFFVYVLHKNNKWALMPTHYRIGHWDRNDTKYKGKKFGRTDLDGGSEHGWPSIRFADKSVRAYLKFCDTCKSITAIHQRALIDVFGCETRKVGGMDVIYHPKNEPFPSYRQFYNIIIAEFGRDQVQLTVYGHIRMRRKATVDVGSYINQYKNALEHVEVDAYRCPDRPHAMFSDEPLPPLIVARAICVKTGGIVGVGFSLGGEKRDAYRSMLLCMVLPKSMIAKIYGIPDEMLDWVMTGMPLSMISDRGPAGFEALLDELEIKIPIKSTAPSYEPRSKPSIEGSNPKTPEAEGQPEYILSDLNLVEMIKRELMRAVRENRSKDISSHMSEEEVLEFVHKGLPATPDAYWRYLTGRLRTRGYEMDAVEAIKTFCKQTECGVDRAGVVVHKRHYSSDRFREDGCHAKALRRAPKDLKAYCVPLATRYVWTEFDGRFFELEALKSGSADGEDYNIPLSALAEVGDAMAVLQSRTRKSGAAAGVRVAKDFQELTGVAWDAGVRRKGKVPKGRGTSGHEAAVLDDRRRMAA